MRPLYTETLQIVTTIATSLVTGAERAALQSAQNRDWNGLFRSFWRRSIAFCSATSLVAMRQASEPRDFIRASKKLDATFARGVARLKQLPYRKSVTFQILGGTKCDTNS
ncbi:hypothetical protein NKH98_05545 [Mesorhizobium sp. M0833]|uniref:hypothetical protein n=1 Tax=Mesorhizobium sp. M0833 TaxID=2957009 RepID=UPI00333610D2